MAKLLQNQQQGKGLTAAPPKVPGAPMKWIQDWQTNLERRDWKAVTDVDQMLPVRQCGRAKHWRIYSN